MENDVISKQKNCIASTFFLRHALQTFKYVQIYDNHLK